MYVCMYACMYVYICVCAYVHICLHTHTHTYSHTHTVRSKTITCQKILTLGGHLIFTVPEVKILGLTFSNDLNW